MRGPRKIWTRIVPPSFTQHDMTMCKTPKVTVDDLEARLRALRAKPDLRKAKKNGATYGEQLLRTIIGRSDSRIGVDAVPGTLYYEVSSRHYRRGWMTRHEDDSTSEEAMVCSVFAHKCQSLREELMPIAVDQERGRAWLMKHQRCDDE